MPLRAPRPPSGPGSGPGAPRALFLDFDGLICDTERAAHQSWQELYTRLGLVFDRRVWARMTGRSNGEDTATAELARRLGRPLRSGELAWRRERKQWLCDQEPLRPGVAALIDAAAGRALALAVVSSSSRSWVRPHLERLHVHHRFHVVVTGDDTPAHKPAPDLYHLALARTGLGPGAVVAFEDSPSGVRAAQAAGLRCVAVPSSVGSRADVAGADVVLDSLADYRPDAAFAVMEGMVTR